jgi:hypothetical protein
MKHDFYLECPGVSSGARGRCIGYAIFFIRIAEFVTEAGYERRNCAIREAGSALFAGESVS